MPCPGQLLKRAAAIELSICARSNERPHLGVRCQLSAMQRGSLTFVRCRCGLVCTLQSGVVAGVPLFSSMCSMEIAKYATKLLRNASLRTLSLPLARSFTSGIPLCSYELYESVDALRTGMDDSYRQIEQQAVSEHAAQVFGEEIAS